MDSAHLFAALPLLYVVGAGSLARPRVSWWPGRSGKRALARWSFGLVCAGFVTFAVFAKASPKIYSWMKLARTDRGISLVETPQEWLHFERANIYFVTYADVQREPIRAFPDVVSYIRAEAAEDEKIFAFPALPMLYFVGERDNPTRQDYFLGVNVSFPNQLELIRTLEDRQVPLVVVNAPNDYFVARSRDYTRLIQTYLRNEYYLERQIGSFDVPRRYDTAPDGVSRVGRSG